jgi:hypothetical protein
MGTDFKKNDKPSASGNAVSSQADNRKIEVIGTLETIPLPSRFVLLKASVRITGYATVAAHSVNRKNRINR